MQNYINIYIIILCVQLSGMNKKLVGTSLVVQWLRVCTPNAEGPGSVTGQGTRSHMPQQRSSAAK